MAIQLKQPNLNISIQAGRCLEFTEDSFDVPNLYANAWEAYQATEFKHLDRDFPDAAVPVWFDWSGNILWTDGIVRYGRYGHAAVRTPDEKIHSAPGVGVGSITFNSVDELTSYFGNGMTYVAWSEDIAGVKVIEGEDMAQIASADEIRYLLRGITGYEPDQKLVDAYYGQSYEHCARDMIVNMFRYGGDFLSTRNRLESELTAVKNQKPVANDDSSKKLQAIKDALGVK